MSFGGKSFKREELRMKRELQELSKQSKSEYSHLNIDDKSKLRLEKIQRAPRKREENSLEKKSGTRKQIGTPEIDNDELNEGELEDTAEIPPPSPSIDLGPELRSSPGADTPSTVLTNKETHLRNSLTYEQRHSGLISRSTGVASIRSRVDFSVVMQGKGLVDQENSPAGNPKDTKKSMVKPQSAKRFPSPLRKTPLEEKRTKPAIIGSQSTAVAVQLTPRPSPRQNQRPSSGASIQSAAKGYTSSVRTAELIDSSTPATLSELEDAANVYHTPEPEKDVSGCKKEDMLEASLADQEDNGIHNKDLLVTVDIDENVVAREEDKDAQFDPSNDISQLSLTGGCHAEIHVEEEKSPVDRIHSEILELTRKISLPDAGILSLIRASGETVDEAKKQQGSPPSKESLLMRALADQQNSNLSIYAGLKSISTSILPKTPFANNKGIPYSDDQAVGTRNTAIDKEGSSEQPRKGNRVTVASEAGGGEGTSRQDGPPMTADRTTGTGGSEMTGKDVFASQSGYEFSSRHELPSQRTMTDEQAFKSLLLPPEVAPEDIISIKGQQVGVFTKEVMAPINIVESAPNEAKDKWIRVKEQKEVTFLDSWQFKETDKEVKPIKTHNIHHFCTMPASVELPPYLCRVTRDEHTRDRFNMVTGRPAHTVFTDGLSWIEEEGNEEGEEDENMAKSQRNTKQRRWSVVAQDILNKAAEAEDTDEMLVRLKNASDELFSAGAGENLDIVGVKIQLKDDTSRLYWTPAPPKMNLAPATIKSHLYPDYQSTTLFQESVATDYRTATGVDSDDNDETQGEVDSETIKTRNRILSREHGSMTDLHKLVSDTTHVQRPKTDYGGAGDAYARIQTEGKGDSGERAGIPDRFTSVLDQRRHEIKQREEIETKGTDFNDDLHGPEQLAEKTKGVSILRSMSHPLLSVSEHILKVPAGYDVSMDELNYQRDQIAAIKAKLEDRDGQEVIASGQSVLLEKSATAATISSHGRSIIMDLHDQSREFDTDEARTDTENMSVQTTVSRATGVTKMSKRKLALRKLRKKTKKELEREQEIQEFLQQTARQISRSRSFTDLTSLAKEEKENFKQENESWSTRVDLGKANSVPTILDLDKFINEDLTGPSDDVFDDIRERFWYVWFDEVYPPTPALPEIKFDLQSLSTPRPDTRSKSTVAIVNNDILDDIQVIEPQVSTTDQELFQALQEEVIRLADLIDATEKKELCAIHLCRRGAVYRKIGQLKKAWDDLNRSIELEPKLLDAYWHRHLLHLLQDNRKAALDDLTFIIKNSSTQARAFRSRAELYRQESDATMAIVSYSQAIKLNPNDAETYYQRAAMFKMRGDMILALEDYKIAAKLLPSKTEAMFEIGVYHFNNQNWQAACNDFTNLLHQDPEDSKAYTYRARVHAKMDNYEAALKDLAAAVHYDPNNAVAFYHRGCLLRKVHPKRALQDFSVSLLLDSSLENVKCFLHRGILYTELKRWEDAVPDFEAALQLDSSVASAHVNIGLIYIIKHSNYHKAVRRYTAAIRVDPTYIRAYISRAEAYHKLHLLQDAILDYTRVIHMRPDISDYHMARGKLLLKQNKLELASFHVRQAADLNRGLGASATQQAVVQSFLRNFDQAIGVLERATRVRPVAPLFVLLGKTNMKAKRFQNAINSFERAIEIMSPWNSRMEIPVEAAGVHYLIGMCHSELGRPLDALEAFNSAIRVNPDYAEAFYQRGLTKMKLKHAKGIHDFNRALAINPTLFQAFLSRAAYYGMKGRHSKGIMSCNEAIKLQPRSVRAFLYRGALKYNIKAYSLAVKDLTEAVAIDCKCSLAYFNRAVCYHEMRFFQKALMDYGTVMLLEEKPNLKVLQNRGLLYFEIDDVENALQDFLAASKVSPGDPKLRHTLGLCYHRLNRLEEAVLSYNDALRIDPFFVEAYNGRGNALMDFGHEDGTVLGRHDYLKALHMDPLCLSARVNLGYNLQVEGKFQAAWNQFSAAITIDSSCQSALEGRAVVNLQMGNSFGAFIDMNDAIKISKTAELLTNRGVVQQFMGDSVNAIRDYQAAVTTDPSYALAYYNAANIYFRQRQFHQPPRLSKEFPLLKPKRNGKPFCFFFGCSEALNYYNKALSWYADDESAVLNRAITKVMLKDSKGAIQDFNRAVELNPYAAHVYFNRGNLFASLRRYKEAEEDYTRALSLRPGDALVYKRRADVLGRQGKKAAAIEDYRRAIVIQTTKH